MGRRRSRGGDCVHSSDRTRYPALDSNHTHNMRKSLSSLLIGFATFITLPSAGLAQTAESNPHDAQPERPSVATHAWTVAPGWIEIEVGTEFDRYDDHAHGETAPLVAKVGLTRRTQLEFQTPLVHSRGLHAAA